jgi:mannose-1-phosphate guanylyltransferase/mannose-6-phosphate isomerase
MYPKQLLPLVGDRTMLQETAMRTRGVEQISDRPIVVCNEAHRFLVAEQLLAEGMEAEIILEPEGRNTAPATALAALHALSGHGTGSEDCLLLVMPADHVIENLSAFHDALATGEAAARSGKLVTFGVVPDSPNTGYGYIEADSVSGREVPVLSFVEKPDRAVAESMLETGRFYWNAGIFLFQASAYLEELEKWRPDIIAACKSSYSNRRDDTDFVRPGAAEFKASPADSIDYAVMENTDRAVVVALDAGWSDVGSWSALHAISPKDDDGNTVSGDATLIDCRDTLVRAKSRLVAAVGLDDLIIAEDKDTVLIASKKSSQDVRKVVMELDRRGREETRLHRQVFRPWGSYDSIDSGDGFQVKRLIVKPGAILSLQKHAHRSEHWVVVRGTARITRDEEVFDLGVNQSVHIPLGAVHRIENPGDEPVHIIEVQCGDYLGEDDIVRLDDNYGRAGTNT